MRFNRLSAALLTLATLFHTWRAYTTSFTTDEAFTVLDFVSRPWLTLLTTYDANHHILFSLLAKLSYSVFGWYEAAFRLPSLLAAAAFLFLAFRIARRLFPRSPLALVLCAWLALHPNLIDWFSLARGYALALAFLAAAIDELTLPLPNLRRASLWLGLSAASNLVFTISSLSLLIAWILARRAYTRALDLLLPGLAACFIIIVIPLSHAPGGNFYYGTTSLIESLTSVAGIPGFVSSTYALAAAGPAVLLLSLWFLKDDENARLLSWALSLSLAAIAALRIFGLPYPLGRTGSYLVVLWIPLLALLAARVPHRLIWLPALAPALLFVLSIDPLRYPEWRFDSTNRRAMETAAAVGPPHAPVAASQPLQFGLEFYRRRLGLSSMPPVELYSPGSPARFVLIRTGHAGDPPPPGARLIWADKSAGTEFYAR